MTTFRAIKSKYDTYNFGELYLYWKHFKKNINDPFFTRYIYPTFESLKEELIGNPICCLTMEQYLNEYQKAICHKNSYFFKKLVAQPETGMLIGSSHPMFFGHVFEILPGTEISANHLISVMVYCNYSIFAYEFSKTYRQLENDDLKQSENTYTNIERKSSMQARHSKFYHIARYINELVHVYSPRAGYTKPFVSKFYHGVSQKLKFISFRSEMYQPFSTTTSWEVAVAFGGNDGMVLELNCDVFNRYFDCQYVSDFANEKELLFINTVASLKFVNIIDLRSGHHYGMYIKALGIIDAMTTGQPFQPDSVVQYNVSKQKNLIKRYNLELNGAKPIDPRLKLLTIKLIKHELHQYQPQKYKQIRNLDPYINNLLHYMCTLVQTIYIDCVLMSVEIIPEYTRGGYNGFLFLKSLFYNEYSGMIDLDFITLLFPNTNNILLLNRVPPSVKCLDYILEYLTNESAKSVIIFTVAHLNDPNCLLKQNYYAERFKKIKWVLNCNKQQTQLFKGTKAAVKNEIGAEMFMQLTAQPICTNLM
eukprot:354786_1